MRPDVIAIDSIQAVQDPDAPGGPGSVSQVRDGALRAQLLAKDLGIATLLVGHVTKDGSLAGPRTLEHVVDTVLSFEGDRHHALRMLRALKHRFGPTDELGLMEMTGEGLVPVLDPSALFLADRRLGACGSVVAAVLEGTRPLCVEVQALVAKTPAPMPRRVAQSFDGGRLAMLVAIVQQRADVALAGQDIFASVAGGVKVSEPGADLAVALAIASARDGAAVAADTVVIGELGLGGEVRQVPQIGRRLAEAQRLGFVRAIVPTSTPDVAGHSSRPRRRSRRSDEDRRHLTPADATRIFRYPRVNIPTWRGLWPSPDRNPSTERCGSSRPAHRCATASTASCKRRWAR